MRSLYQPNILMSTSDSNLFMLVMSGMVKDTAGNRIHLSKSHNIPPKEYLLIRLLIVDSMPEHCLPKTFKTSSTPNLTFSCSSSLFIFLNSLTLSCSAVTSLEAHLLIGLNSPLLLLVRPIVCFIIYDKPNRPIPSAWQASERNPRISAKSELMILIWPKYPTVLG